MTTKQKLARLIVFLLYVAAAAILYSIGGIKLIGAAVLIIVVGIIVGGVVIWCMDNWN